jgi:hypothetical protein
MGPWITLAGAVELAHWDNQFAKKPCFKLLWMDNKQNDSMGSDEKSSRTLNRRQISVQPYVTHLGHFLQSEQLKVERNADRSLISVEEAYRN